MHLPQLLLVPRLCLVPVRDVRASVAKVHNQRVPNDQEKLEPPSMYLIVPSLWYNASKASHAPVLHAYLCRRRCIMNVKPSLERCRLFFVMAKNSKTWRHARSHSRPACIHFTLSTVVCIAGTIKYSVLDQGEVKDECSRSPDCCNLDAGKERRLFIFPKHSQSSVHQVLLHPGEVERVQNVGSPKTSRNNARIAINTTNLGAASYTLSKSRL